ncbi:cyclic GMP-AMP synthase DncV-like nucleotidyltransferase [Pseudomonas sp. p106]|uniref:CBASS cGAMP synthase n=1 Tax=Pseudomonas sp. p106 TaxID=2479854 RepID=UPI000F7B0F77|nr:hypothetical protein [Pseudomonas sp. p106]RRV39232.1 hypothetical protein EGJ09_25505 [Pseudomonas sp. p106]
MLDLSKLFHTETTDDCLLEALELTDVERAYIAAAKEDVRNCLRTGVPRVLRDMGYKGEVPKPRFFTQGSWAYKTLNAPAHIPPQQGDCDDGAYLPISFLKGTRRPSVASAVFFTAAETALEDLVKENQALGWKLIRDKDTCIRIQISTTAHIDIPLYSIPDEEFVTLAKAATRSGYMSFDEAFNARGAESWADLPTDQVMLAHRKDDWVSSDPRPVKNWFVDQVTDKGEQLRRIVRYLKAYRDWQWKAGGPSSILLMAVATPLFTKVKGRDDLALLEVLKGLPDALRKGVNNPVDESESLTARLSAEELEEAAEQFEKLESNLNGAVNASDPASACVWLRKMFGPRFPERTDLVRVVTVASTIAAIPAESAASEFVGTSKAG